MDSAHNSGTKANPPPRLLIEDWLPSAGWWFGILRDGKAKRALRILVEAAR